MIIRLVASVCVMAGVWFIWHAASLPSVGVPLPLVIGGLLAAVVLFSKGK